MGCLNFLISLDIRKKLFKTDEHADVATVLNNIATVYFTMGQLDKALETSQRANGNIL